MPVLSDTSIKTYLAKQELVVEGDDARAEHCAYEFTAAKLYFGGAEGTTNHAIVFERGSNQSAIIDPGVLVWIRSRETVKMPADKVGLWIQTNTLSRKGLLLLNMSLVEPGYEGFLTAAFVNFGRTRVAINSETKIAKLMFLELDQAAGSLVPSMDQHTYDANTESIALLAPRTFLRVEDFLPDLGRAEREAAEQISKAANEANNEINTNLENQKKHTRESISQAVEADIKKFIWKALGGFGFGAFAFCVAFGFLYSRFFPAVIKDWDARADVATDRALQANSVLSDIQNLRTEIDARKHTDDLDAIIERLDALERRIAEIAVPNHIPPGDPISADE